MKRIIPYILFAGIFLISCEYEETHQPFSDFNVDFNLVVPMEVISFNNLSLDAVRYEWDFGDGSYSTKVNPTHYYRQEGTYEVELAASYGNRVDYSYLTVDVYYTTLEVVVREYSNVNNFIDYANVDIYPSEYDYMHWSNVAFLGETDQNGRVTFKGLNSQSYYIDVYNKLFTNSILASEDINHIRTEPLAHAMHNEFTALVDYEPSPLKASGDKLKVREFKITTKKRTLDTKQTIK